MIYLTLYTQYNSSINNSHYYGISPMLTFDYYIFLMQGRNQLAWAGGGGWAPPSKKCSCRIFTGLLLAQWSMDAPPPVEIPGYIFVLMLVCSNPYSHCTFHSNSLVFNNSRLAIVFNKGEISTSLKMKIDPVKPLCLGSLSSFHTLYIVKFSIHQL